LTNPKCVNGSRPATTSRVAVFIGFWFSRLLLIFSSCSAHYRVLIKSGQPLDLSFRSFSDGAREGQTGGSVYGPADAGPKPHRATPEGRVRMLSHRFTKVTNPNQKKGEVGTMKRILTLAVAAAFGMAASAASAQTLNAVKQRGVLNCGSNTSLAGFGMPDAQGKWTGLDVDFCRAVAAAIFNDPTKVKFVPLTAKDRFTALQSGEVDLLVRNTTWTSSRETQLGLLFAGVNYYDGQGFMVRKSLKVNSALELNDAAVCVQQGTTTELNLADYFRANKMKLKTVTFADSDQTIKAYDAGRCDAFTTDASGLYAERLRLTNPNDHIVLPEIISKEPLGPVVRKGDDDWFNIVRWTHFVMLNAEEAGITQANVDEMLKSSDPNVRRLLGTEGNFGEQFGLTKDWMYRVIKLVGNYGEVFERNVGQGSPLKIARGLNALWTKGGLQYGAPVR
jgi:general L-amino acid transport system substrate-binding protein